MSKHAAIVLRSIFVTANVRIKEKYNHVLSSYLIRVNETPLILPKLSQLKG